MEKKLVVKLRTVGDLKKAYNAFIREGFGESDLVCPPGKSSQKEVGPNGISKHRGRGPIPAGGSVELSIDDIHKPVTVWVSKPLFESEDDE